MSARPNVVVLGAFDEPRGRPLRFLEEAAKIGPVTILLSSDELAASQEGRALKHPLPERLYVLKALRWVEGVATIDSMADEKLRAALENMGAEMWVDEENKLNAEREVFCRRHGPRYEVLPAFRMAGFATPAPAPAAAGKKKVVVTGCFDWLHSGHVRFFEEVSAYGDLYVIVGHDANIRLLKGEGHPMILEQERRYCVSAIKHVREALISSGHGWLDADPEIERIRPDIYAVNEDGDKGGKREYCARRGIEYLTLKRAPAPGMPPRTSTALRGF